MQNTIYFVEKEQKINVVLKYVKSSLAKGIYPKANDLHKKFRIYDYGIDIKTIYSKLGINFLLLPNKSHLMVEEIRKLLIDYIKNETSNGHYPTRREIQNKFRVSLSPVLFKGIKELYEKTNVTYKQVENQSIKIEKAKMFLKLVLNILERMEFEVLRIREPNQPGIDIIVDTPNGKIGIELKAYNKFERIKKKDILQLKRFLEKERLKRAFIFTTTSRVPKNLPMNFKILTFQKLKKYCDKNELIILNEIREKSVHIETKEREEKRQKILDFIRENIKTGKCVSAIQILKETGLYPYTYFKNMDEVYEKSGIEIPLSRLKCMRDKNLIEKVKQQQLQKILNFIKEEVKKEHYPSGEDINTAFMYSNIWNRFKVGDLYRMLKLPTYLERIKNGSFCPFKR